MLENVIHKGFYPRLYSSKINYGGQSTQRRKNTVVYGWKDTVKVLAF